MKSALPQFAIEIIARREAHGLSQQELAEQLGVEPGTVSRWETGRNRPKTKETLSRLKSILGFEQHELNRLYVEMIMHQKESNYSIRGVEFLEMYGLDEYNLLERLIEIDLSVIQDLREEEEGTIDQWAPIFHASPYTWRLITIGDQIAGYWAYFSLNDEQFQLAKSGQLKEANLNGEMLVPIEIKEKTYNMFISMIVIDRKHHHPENSSRLLMSFVNEFVRFTKDGFLFSEICAVAYTTSGIHLCSNFGMQKVGRQQGVSESRIADVFLVAGKDIARNGILSKNPIVSLAYRKRFG